MRRVSGLLAAFLLTDCVLPADIVKQRFSMDAQCDESSVRVSSLPGSAYRAEGCSAVAIYVCTVQEGSLISCIREPDPRPLAAGEVAAPSR